MNEVNPYAGEDSAQQAVEQQKQADRKVPGDEGYVHPDGTPQSIRQMADNERAAADRAAAGSAVHGAPAATPGPQYLEQAAAAQARAEADSPVTMAESREGLSNSVAEGFEKATEKAEQADTDVTASAAAATPAPKRTADPKPNTTR